VTFPSERTPAWSDDWWGIGVARLAVDLWRGVEAQHVPATLRLVDHLEEQKVLEDLLEASKPPLPREAQGCHYLVATPFRYRSPHASRFRRAGHPGVWYGAQELHTACTELAYWRWRFLSDVEGGPDQLLVDFTLFQARVDGTAVDLTSAPWVQARASWIHPDDYSQCQALADEARERKVQWIRYDSARASGGRCAAVMDPRALAIATLHTQQTWTCKVTRSTALIEHGSDRLSLSF